MHLLDRIDGWAASAPDRLAHVSPDGCLTYRELRDRSDALAAHLAATLPDDRRPVAVVGHKEPGMLVAFLGAAKAGRPYVPIDTSLPEQRIRGIIEQADAAVTLTPTEVDALAARPAAPPSRRVEADDPYYIIFTSGSTGEPKGVVIPLDALTSFVDWMIAEQGPRPAGEVFLNQAPFSFDLSVMDLYMSLASGGTLTSLTRDELASPRRLYERLAVTGATMWVSTPSFAQMCLVERRFDRAMLPAVRRFLFCGETLPPAVAEQLLDRFPDAQVWNTYGPTEATVATTSIQVDREVLARYAPLPVGVPRPASRVLIVDDELRPVPDGERGEILIVGPHVSPGYLGRPDLNARAFLTVDGQRAYRSGDWGYFRDGLLFFEGRIDGQVKLHGYRIELGDVEANLRALDGVRDAVVVPVVKNGQVESLAAFVVLAAPTDETPSRLTQRLKGRLAERVPAYMLPYRFRYLDAFPLTANGKADRRALADSLA